MSRFTVPAPVPQPPTAADLQLLADLFAKFPSLFPQPDPRARVTIGEVIDEYLLAAKEELDRRTSESRSRHLMEFRVTFGSQFVTHCTPLLLRRWFAERTHRCKAVATRASVNVSVQRAMNWSVIMGLIDKNPFKGYRVHGEKNTGRHMTEPEFQAVLRHTDVFFRQFLIALKFTGARPGELAKLKWSMIDWTNNVAVLEQHKSRWKTHKPRIIVLVPAVVKLLQLIRRQQNNTPAACLRRIFESDPGRTVHAVDLRHAMLALGYSERTFYLARKAIGAVHRRVGGWREYGHWLYELPPEPVEKPHRANDHVFLTSKGRPWRRESLTQKFMRIRQLVGLPADCKTYSVRHAFATKAIRQNVPLKPLATLMGHRTTLMLERVYVHIDKDYELLQAAAQAAVSLTSSSRPLPALTVARQEDVAQYPRAVPKKKRKKPARSGRKKTELIDAIQIAWQAHEFAVKKSPALRNGTDLQIFEWLIGRREFAGQLPTFFPTFRRYLHRARHYYLGAAKRKLGHVTNW